MSLINHINRPKLSALARANLANISPNMAPKIMVSMIKVAEIVIISPPGGISNSPIKVPMYPEITPAMPPINPATAPAPPPLFRDHSPPVELMRLYLV